MNVILMKNKLCPASLLQPTECRVRGAVRFSDAWAGSFATFAKCQTTGAIYVCGLNNYGQLGLADPTSLNFGKEPIHLSHQSVGDNLGDVDPVLNWQHADKSEAKLIETQGPLIQFMLTRAYGFDLTQYWTQFAISMHHTLAMNKQGNCKINFFCD